MLWFQGERKKNKESMEDENIEKKEGNFLDIQTQKIWNREQAQQAPPPLVSINIQLGGVLSIVMNISEITHGQTWIIGKVTY